MAILPTISIVIPTLNSRSVLDECLRSITIQKYPQANLEIIISDGGSIDGTIELSKKYKTKIVFNRLKTAESGKAAAVKIAKGDLIALIDSDNILPNNHWLLDMISPFKNKEILLAEPISYTYRKSDPLLTRYFALLGMNDPICLFIGNYDRYSYLTNKWTGLNFSQTQQSGYLQVTLDKTPIPTIGANGTIYRSQTLKRHILDQEYLFDIDILHKVIKKEGVAIIAKVTTGIVHTFVERSPQKFFRKQLRRINDLSYHQSQKSREINWEKSFKFGIAKFIASCLFVFPIIYQTALGYSRKPDRAWFFHPIACYSTFFIYIYGWIRGKISPSESSRQHWRQ